MMDQTMAAYEGAARWSNHVEIAFASPERIFCSCVVSVVEMWGGAFSLNRHFGDGVKA